MDNCLYLDELLYAKQMRLPDLIEYVKNPAFTLSDTITWADAARADLITELQMNGCDVMAAKKGPGSIKDGIDLMQSYSKIYVTKNSINLRKEFANYVWVKDKDGINKSIPIDKWNHGIDASRYAELMHKYVTAVITVDFNPNNPNGFSQEIFS